MRPFRCKRADGVISGTGPVLPDIQLNVEKSHPGTSLESCAAACYLSKMTTAGVLDGEHCFCGTTSQLGGSAAKALSVPKRACTGVPCRGKGSEKECGGPDAMLAYAFSCDKLSKSPVAEQERANDNHNPATSYSMRIDLTSSVQ